MQTILEMDFCSSAEEDEWWKCSFFDVKHFKIDCYQINILNIQFEVFWLKIKKCEYCTRFCNDLFVLGSFSDHNVFKKTICIWSCLRDIYKWRHTTLDNFWLHLPHRHDVYYCRHKITDSVPRHFVYYWS